MIELFINRPYLPEGMNKSYQENAASLSSLSDCRRYADAALPLEVTAERCDLAHNLHGTLNGFPFIMERRYAISPSVSGGEKEISVLSLVGRKICAVIDSVTQNDSGTPLLHLSRKQVQEEALPYLLETLHEGDVIPGTVLSMSPIGAFVDIGCGIVALLPIRQISVSRLTHPSNRFFPNQQILCVLEKSEPSAGRFLLSHKELLGTWSENAAQFHEGETVTGVVRGIKDYGVFVELAPNLTGLTEPNELLREGDRVSVLIKTILPERHKIKLHIVSILPPSLQRQSIHYFIRSGNVLGWSYETP